jgi:hypothetical protein
MRHLLFFSLSFCLCSESGHTATTTEVNIAGVPIDNYFSANGGQLPSCNSSWTVQQCIKYFFNNNPNSSPYTPNNYIAQGVTGVRFFFTLRGGFASTPFDASGNLQTQWLQNFRTFLSDLHSYGIVRVTPTPVIDPGWGDPTFTPNPTINDCTGQIPLMFLPWMPFGYRTTDGVPDCADNNNGYNIANANTGTNPSTGEPIFWGWRPLFNLFNQIFAKMSSVGLQLGELDFENEVNLQDFTVYGRLLYDNGHSTDVIGTLRSYAANYGFNQYAITVSVPGDQPSIAAWHCGSLYGDSAYFMKASELLAGYAGPYSLIGLPSGFLYTNHLVCAGSTAGMISLPVYYRTPSVTDNHVYPCVFSFSLGHCDPNQNTTSTATQMYSDLWTFLQYRGLTANTAMMGETQSGQNCDNYTAAMATQNVNGYKASRLYANHAGSTTMRVWNNEADVSHCYVIPTIINPPYGNY